MDDAAVRMPAFAREVQRTFVTVAVVMVEGHAEPDQPLDRQRRVLDHEFDRFAPVEPAAGDHRVADVILEGVARIEHRGDSALRPGGGPCVERALGQHQHTAPFGKHQRGGESGGARTDDKHVRAHALKIPCWHRRPVDDRIRISTDLSIAPSWRLWSAAQAVACARPESGHGSGTPDRSDRLADDTPFRRRSPTPVRNLPCA